MVLSGANLKPKGNDHSMTGVNLLLCKFLQDREQITDMNTDQ